MPKRGAKKPEIVDAKRSKWLWKKEGNVEVELSREPTEYDGALHASKVRTVTRRNFPGVYNSTTGATKLPPRSETGLIRFPVSRDVMKRDPEHPEVYAIRLSAIVPLEVQDLIGNQWLRLVALGGVKTECSKDGNRSVTGAAHLGIWSHYSGVPYITKDTYQRKSSPEVQAATDELCHLVAQHLAPIIKRIIQIHSPSLIPKLERAHAYVQANLDDPSGKWRYINFLGAFSAFAVKEGSSEKLHLDFHDTRNFLTFMVPFALEGSYSGGYFFSPNLGAPIPVRPGDIMGAMTNLLGHCGTRATGGRRLVVTCFLDKFLMLHANQHWHIPRSPRPPKPELEEGEIIL
ncbi:hypothetical protein DFP72DRAFT_1106136 [Ephemerocybe angulata]|uniref:Uncharacterized protein n=1 Tax=Ephemerocybe angulata TaxID=980116 RepID=A0A8H6HAN8_9AGAR|nr:hypothetical protein DFP72DRAFT_1106136 [Tulosesus angulatus]